MRHTLTRTQRELLRQMAFREAEPGGPCWVVAAGNGGIYVLCVMTVMGWYARHSRVSAGTLQRLHDAGLIQYGPEVPMPEWFTPARGEATSGRTASLTDTGHAALRLMFTGAQRADV